MLGKRLYPNTKYFVLLKELLGCKVGDEVSIYDADSRRCLSINGIDCIYMELIQLKIS